MSRKQIQAEHERLAATLRSAAVRRESHKRHRFNLYSFGKKDEGVFSLPFTAPTDEAALAAFKGFLTECPPIAGSDLFCVGSFYTDDCTLFKETHKRLILDK